MNMLTAMLSTAAEGTAGSGLIFDPANFVKNLEYMGVGMLVIFVIIGIIILCTALINKSFSK